MKSRKPNRAAAAHLKPKGLHQVVHVAALGVEEAAVVAALQLSFKV